MTAFDDFGKKFGRKIDQNFTIFFFQQNEYKTRSETRFHQNRQYRVNFSLTTARHEKSTAPEGGLNSKGPSIKDVTRWRGIGLRFGPKNVTVKFGA